MVLEPEHFLRTDDRAAALAHIAGLMSDPWPWGFMNVHVDETALAGGALKVECEGVFPDGTPFARSHLSTALPEAEDHDGIRYELSRSRESGALRLQVGGEAAGENTLPIARLIRQGGIWSRVPGWSPPVILIGPEHPLRSDVNRHLGALAALGVGFGATLRLPGAENRPVARLLGQVAVVLAQGVGVIETLLSAPAVTPGRIGMEALRLALGTRAAAGVFEPLPGAAWSPADQRGSLRELFRVAETAASGIGLPFRTAVFQPSGTPGVLVVEVPPGTLLLAIEASQPADLLAARNWLEGAALAAPDRIQEALARRVAGCMRHPVERDATIGVSSGPLLALYRVDDDFAWRAGQPLLALAAESPPPADTSFSMLIAEGIGGSPPPLLESPDARGRGSWAGRAGGRFER